MTDKYYMRFRVQTLVDVTETNARRSDDSFKWRQQQNYMTLLQTVGLRVNPTIESSPKMNKMSVGNMGFGSYSGKQNVWSFTFSIEYEHGLTVNMLEEDFNLVPVVNNLDETIKLEESIFVTSGEKTNIVFKEEKNE